MKSCVLGQVNALLTMIETGEHKRLKTCICPTGFTSNCEDILHDILHFALTSTEIISQWAHEICVLIHWLHAAGLTATLQIIPPYKMAHSIIFLKSVPLALYM